MIETVLDVLTNGAAIVLLLGALGILIPLIVMRLPGVRHLFTLIPWTRRRFYTTRFCVKDFDDRAVAAHDAQDRDPTFGAGVAALIRQETQRLPSDPRLDRPAEFALATYTTDDPLSGDAGVLADGSEGSLLHSLLHLARRIPPRELLKLEGTLLASGDRGPGLSLSLAGRNGEVLASETLWEEAYNLWDSGDAFADGHESEPDPRPNGGKHASSRSKQRGAKSAGRNETVAHAPSDADQVPERRHRRPRTLLDRYYLLATVGAAWTQFQLVKLYTRPEEPGAKDRRPPGVLPGELQERQPQNDAERVAAVVGTYDWQSYALLRAGLYWQEREQLNKARVLYVQALGRDPDNVLATFQLGVLDVLLSNYVAARDRLERVPPMAERARLVAEHDRLTLSPRPKDDDWNIEDMPPATPLWYQAMYNLVRARFYVYKAAGGPLAAAQGDARRLAKAHLRALLLLEEHVTTLDEDARTLRTFLTHLEGVTLILFAGVVLESVEGGQDPLETRMHLADADLSKQSVVHDNLDALTPLQILEYVLGARELTDRGHYNLVCLYSRFAGCTSPKLTEEDRERYLGLALDALKSGLSPVPAHWPWADLDLETVRSRKWEEFDQVIQTFARPEVRNDPARDDALRRHAQEGAQSALAPG